VVSFVLGHAAKIPGTELDVNREVRL
jgi:hypothetical protein